MGSTIRKIERNVLKNTQNNNKINGTWKDYMSYKYSYGELTNLYRKNKKRK